jgi:hypothetical protein
LYELERAEGASFHFDAMLTKSTQVLDDQKFIRSAAYDASYQNFMEYAWNANRLARCSGGGVVIDWEAYYYDQVMYYHHEMESSQDVIAKSNCLVEIALMDVVNIMAAWFEKLDSPEATGKKYEKERKTFVAHHKSLCRRFREYKQLIGAAVPTFR